MAIREVAEELSDTSPEFASIWRRHEIGPANPATEVAFEHLEGGPLVFQPISLRPELQPELESPPPPARFEPAITCK